MGRAPCCDKVGLKKGPWTPEEDQTLISFIQHHGHSNWRALPKQAGLLRCGKSCRLRWINYLRPDIKRGNFSREEEDSIIQLHELLGNRWSAIAARLPGRTDNEIKNVWHTHLKKRLKEYQPTKSHGKMAKNKSHKINNNATATTTTATDDSSTGYSFPESTSDHIATSGSPQQSSLTSDDMSSSGTEVSSMEVMPNHDTSFVMDVQTFENSVSNLDYLPIIDETFWEPQDLPSLDISEFDNIIIEDNDQITQFESFFNEDQNNISAQLYNNYDEGEDNMEFWLDVFVQAGGAPELPEF